MTMWALLFSNADILHQCWRAAEREIRDREAEIKNGQQQAKDLHSFRRGTDPSCTDINTDISPLGSYPRTLFLSLLVIFPAMPPSSSGLWCNQMAWSASNLTQRGQTRPSEDGLREGKRNAFRECHNAWLKKLWRLRSVDEVFPAVWGCKMKLHMQSFYRFALFLAWWRNLSFFSGSSENTEGVICDRQSRGEGGEFVRLSLWQ